MRNDVFSQKIIASNCFKYNQSEQRLSVKKKILLILCGLGIGVVNGLFGAGGGMLTVPALSLIGGLEQKKAHATAIAVILPLCVVSSIIYFVSGSFESGVILPTVIGVSIGGIMGACLLKKLSDGFVSFMFYGLMLFAGFKMVFA